MKITRIICAIVCLLCILLFAPMALASPSEETVDVAGCYGLDATTPYLGYNQLVDNAQAIFLYETNSDTLMYALNPDMRIYPSSLVKVLTAYLAVTKGDLDEVVTVRKETLDLVPSDAVTIDLLPGEQMTLHDLLQCMMVGSANDAAAVIAAHISGSESAFVEEMNAFVQSIGCQGTQLRNAHGLHDEEQYSTVRDQAKIIATAMENEAFCKIFASVYYRVPATNLSEERVLNSTNFLMSYDSVEIYYDARVTGGRTGIANDGTRCLVSTAKDSDMNMICVLMGAQSTFAENGNTMVYGGFKETTLLYDTVFNSYKTANVIYEGQSMRQIPVVNGDSDLVVGAGSGTCAILPKDVTHEDLSFRFYDSQQTFQAPIEAGALVSRVEIWHGNVCIATSDLYAMHSVGVSAVPPAGGADEEGTGDSGGAGKVIVILIVVVLVFGGILLLRGSAKVKMAAKAKHAKQHRSDRKRSR